MRILLAVDVANTVYKAAAVHPTLSSEGRFTGGLYGFLVAMSKALIHTGATHIVLCRDSKPYIRSTMYPEYKMVRASNKDEDLADRVGQTYPLVLELANRIGLPVWAIPGFESDDLIAHAVKKYHNRFDKIIAVSNDSDLYQLFQYPQFAIWKGNKNGGIYNQANYNQEWGLSAEQLILALSLTGTHNDIAGIAGVGEVTARKALQDPSKLRALRAQHEAIIERNKKLITLPHPDFPATERLPVRGTTFKDRDLIRYCGQYDVEVTKAMLDAFNQLN